MLSLLFAYSLAAKAFAAPNDDNAQTSCMDINNSRTLLNIIWSCITTIFLCTWVSIHPNIPEPIDTDRMSPSRRVIISIRRFISDKIPLFICALFIPEYILAWAIRQHLVARELANKNNFSKTHGFFIIMGGFHYFPEGPVPVDSSRAIKDNPSSIALLERPSGTNAATDAKQQISHPLDPQQVISMVNSGAITLPTKSEIRDRSKSDWIAKSIVLLQTTWFIIQCIARRIERLPTTELEIVTLAYTAINFGIFIAWWNKPQSVDCPIRVSQAPPRTEDKEADDWFDMACLTIVGAQDSYANLHRKRKVPRFYGGDMEDDYGAGADGITLLVGVVFGAIHCIAWSFEFTSRTEALLWRIASVSITGAPVIIPVASGVVALNSDDRGHIGSFLVFLVFSLFGVLYVAARFTTLILALMNLSSAPPGVFQAVHWTTLIPHV